MGLIDKCGKRYSANTDVACNRPEGHFGVHRDKVMKDHSSNSWPDEQCVAVVEPVGDFTVKLWYWSGVTEEIPGVDETNALAYLAEAQDNGNVREAEMHAADGSLAGGFRHLRPALASTDSVG